MIHEQNSHRTQTVSGRLRLFVEPDAAAPIVLATNEGM